MKHSLKLGISKPFYHELLHPLSYFLNFTAIEETQKVAEVDQEDLL